MVINNDMYNEQLFALRLSLNDAIRNNGCTYKTISDWLSDIYDDKYDLAVAMLSKSIYINNELIIPSDDSILAHLHLIPGAVAEKNVNIRMYVPDGYAKINIFTGEITRLGNSKANWTWFN